MWASALATWPAWPAANTKIPTRRRGAAPPEPHSTSGGAAWRDRLSRGCLQGRLSPRRPGPTGSVARASASAQECKGRARARQSPRAAVAWSGTARRPAPMLGEHTAEVLSEIGLEPAAIEKIVSMTLPFSQDSSQTQEERTCHCSLQANSAVGPHH